MISIFLEIGFYRPQTRQKQICNRRVYLHAQNNKRFHIYFRYVSCLKANKKSHLNCVLINCIEFISSVCLSRHTSHDKRMKIKTFMYCLQCKCNTPIRKRETNILYRIIANVFDCIECNVARD